MYGRKIRNKLRLFSPEMSKGKKEDDTGFRLKVEKKQGTLKRNHEDGNQ